MSAYVVSDSTMQGAVAEIVAAGFPAAEATALGRRLWRLNALAMRGRYGAADAEAMRAEEIARDWIYTGFGGEPDGWGGGDVIGELHYQCSEDPAVDEPLYQWLTAFRERTEPERRARRFKVLAAADDARRALARAEKAAGIDLENAT